MEFKGTKGSEQDQRNYGFNILYPNWDCEDVVGFYEQGQEKAFVIGYNQALQDSKAPEMLEEHIKDLELLEVASIQLAELGGSMWQDLVNRLDEKRQLIKEATEL